MEPVHIRAQDMETLVTSLNNLSDGKASAKHICNLLGFIESFATNEATAQSLLNSPITSCILDFFEHEASSVRTQAATLLGMLIRFAPAVNKGIHCPGVRLPSDSSALYDWYSTLSSCNVDSISDVRRLYFGAVVGQSGKSL